MKTDSLRFLFLFVVITPSLLKVTTDPVTSSVVSHSSPKSKASRLSATDLRNYGDAALKRVHTKFKKAINLRNRKYPEFRQLLNIDMTASMKKKYNSNICSFGWVNGKWTRKYKQYLSLANAIVTKRKKPLSPLYNRFKKRQPRQSQMQCMLYAKLYALERMIDGKTLQININFMSPCMKNTITRVFMVNNSKVLPVILILSMGKHKYYFEFDNKMTVTGYGRERREQYKKVKLINFYTEYVPKPKRIKTKFGWSYSQPKRKKINVFKAMKDYEKLRQAHGLSRKLIDKHISKPKKLKANKVKMVKANKNKKIKTRVLYKKWRFWYIPYYDTGTSYRVLSNTNQKKPYHPYAVVKNVWEGNNPNICYQVMKIKGKNHFLYKYIYYNYYYRMTKRRVKFVYKIPTRHYLVNCNV